MASAARVRGPVALAEQPVGVGRPGQRVHLGHAADHQRLRPAAAVVGEVEVRDPLGRTTQRQRRAGVREVGLAHQDVVGARHGQGAGGDPQRVLHVALHEPRRPEPEQRGDEPAVGPGGLGQRDGPLEDGAQLGGGVALRGVQRRGHREQAVQLALVALPARRLGGHDRQRLAMQPDRLGRGEPGRGHLGGPHVVLPGPVGPAAPVVLLGEQRRVVVVPGGGGQLQRLREPPVQQPPLRRADQVVGGVPEQVVGEVVAGAPGADHPTAPELVDGPGHLLGGQVAGLGEDVEREVAAQRGGEAGRLPRRRGGLADPPPQHAAEPLPRAVEPAPARRRPGPPR